jgi:hypothetical protein
VRTRVSAKTLDVVTLLHVALHQRFQRVLEDAHASAEAGRRRIAAALERANFTFKGLIKSPPRR